MFFVVVRRYPAGDVLMRRGHFAVPIPAKNTGDI